MDQKELMQALLDSARDANVRFCVGPTGKNILHAHTHILALRSTVFERMFYGNFKESSHTGCVTVRVEDVEEKAMRNVLQFSYTGAAILNEENLMSTLYAAKKYDLAQLRLACLRWAFDHLHHDSCFLLYEQAQHMQEDQLARVCLDYILSNFESICQNEGIHHLPVEMLMALLSREDLPRNEVYALQAAVKWGQLQLSHKPSDSQTTLHECLKDVLKLIRFKCLSAVDIASNVIPLELMNCEDSLQLLQEATLRGAGKWDGQEDLAYRKGMLGKNSWESPIMHNSFHLDLEIQSIYVEESEISMSLDGRYIAVRTAEASFVVWDMFSESVSCLLSHIHGTVHKCVFSPDSEKLCICFDDSYQIWDVSTYQPSLWCSGGGQDCAFVGTEYFIVGSGRDITLYSVNTCEIAENYPTKWNAGSIIYTVAEIGSMIIYILPVKGGVIRFDLTQLTAVANERMDVKMHSCLQLRRGEWMYFSDSSCRSICRCSTSSALHWPQVTSEVILKDLTDSEIYTFDIHSRGECAFAAVCIGDKVQVWDVNSAKRLCQIVEKGERACFCRFIPSGRALIVGYESGLFRCYAHTS